MKVVKVEYGLWEILDNKNDFKKLGEIREHQMISTNIKSLYVEDKRISTIRNQKEAIQILEEFFAKNKKAIKDIESLIDELEDGISKLDSKYCIQTLIDRKEELVKDLLKLRSYDLY